MYVYAQICIVWIIFESLDMQYVSKLVEERWCVFNCFLFDSFLCCVTRINLKSEITNKLKFNFMYMYIDLHRLDYIRSLDMQNVSKLFEEI